MTEDRAPPTAGHNRYGGSGLVAVMSASIVDPIRLRWLRNKFSGALESRSYAAPAKLVVDSHIAL